MTASATPLPIVRATLAALIDYAGLFPPAQLDVNAAAAEYAGARRGEHAWMLGRFIVRISQIDALPAAIPPGEHSALSVILDTGSAGIERAHVLRCNATNVCVEALEVALSAEQVDAFARELRSRSSLKDLPVYAEVPVDAVPAAAQVGFGAKIRCGGANASAYPSVAHVAQFIRTCANLRIPFKATAGLHHPVRHFNAAAGVTMHGFLNLLGGAAYARSGASSDEIENIVACEDPAAFRFEAGAVRFGERSFTAEQMREVRSLFVAYGSCSFSEPVDDLRSMGVL